MKLLTLISIMFLNTMCFGQIDSLYQRYQQAFLKLDSMLTGQKSAQFKKAVFVTENAFLNNRIDYEKYDGYIQDLVSLSTDWMTANHLIYKYSDSLNVLKNLAVYKILKDTIRIITPEGKAVDHVPYFYDFEDFFGEQDWRNMFVTKLMAYHTGNCHSLPYLYKILADELGATCWLGLTPNHIYIKNRSKKSGWYNTELTSGNFPIDAWITASGYIPLQAIQNGIYMDTLSNQQAIALCVLDLAKGYEFQTKNYYDGFIIQCCDLVMKYHPVNIQAMLLKAETLKRVYEKQKNTLDSTASVTYGEMETLYTKLFESGYREMPESM